MEALALDDRDDLAVVRDPVVAGGEQWAIQAYEVGTASSQPDADLVFRLQIGMVRRLQGRYGELVEQLVQVVGEENSLPGARWHSAAALALIESGREHEVRQLALAEDFQSIPLDVGWSATLSSWADVCSRLRLADRAGELYKLLAPFAGQLASTIGVHVLGSIAWALGTLATTLERYEQAEGHFAAAAEIEARFGAPLLLARTHASWPARSARAAGPRTSTAQEPCSSRPRKPPGLRARRA